MFNGATSAETCFAEPLKQVSAKSLDVLWRLKPGIHAIASMVQWATKPTCERFRYSFIVACLKYRTNIFLKNYSSSIFLPTKDSGSQDVLCTLKTISIMHSCSDVRAIH